MSGQTPQAIASLLVEAVNSTIRGKPDAVRLACTALLAGGHLLVNDVPGTGKTLLAKSLALAIGGTFGRVQCTPDLLPSDITGTSVYQPNNGEWSFRPGPVFANVVLLDELNRASPRTQSALLEPMEEHQVSFDSTTYSLPAPFFCIATQNPRGQVGTFALPESQLDRFALTISMGLPDREAERQILRGHGGNAVVGNIVSVTSLDALTWTIAQVASLHCADEVVEYILDLVAATRTSVGLTPGVSPRVAVSLLACSRAHAVVSGRTFVTPEDVQAVFRSACVHRCGGENHDLAAVWAELTEIQSRIQVPRH
ncbi:MAG TPA: hypothetical protein DEG43_07670 [Acidimicrobiaceae bacterium]|jgi:MoxR-like ATPase|nr:hypothetical protein [Acidimicrobiaceae bacterium]